MACSIPAHIKAPPQVELKQSLVDDSRVGAFCKDVLIPKDCEFGPFEGKIVYDKNNEAVDQKYSWEVYDLETFKFLHIVDATYPDDGNWMRYVCCARFFEEQNIVSTQNGSDVYYRALKDIKPGEELLTWFQPKKKRKRSSLRDSKESAGSAASIEDDKELANKETGLVTGKRKRKPKIIPDSYHGPLDFKNDTITSKKPKKAVDEDDFEPLRPGQKRRRRKKATPAAEQAAVCTPTDNEGMVIKTEKIDEDSQGEVTPEPYVKIEPEPDINSEKSMEDQSNDESAHKVQDKTSGLLQPDEVLREKIILSSNEVNNPDEWEFPEKGKEFIFKLKKEHKLPYSKGKQTFKCDICMVVFARPNKLKRHYLRNHINYKYLSKSDTEICSINLALAQRVSYERVLIKEWKEKEFKQAEERDESFFEKLEKKAKLSADMSGDNETLKVDMVEHPADSLSETGTYPQSNDHVPGADLPKVENNITKENDTLGAEDLGRDVSMEAKDTTEKYNTAVDNKEYDVVNDKIKREELNEIIKGKSNGEFTENDKITVADDQQMSGNINIDTYIESRKDESPPNTTMQYFTNPMEETNTTENNCESVSKTNASEKIGLKEEASSVSSGTSSILQPQSTDVPRNNTMPGLYRCYACYAMYDTVKEIRDHLADNPGKTCCLTCDQCNMRFRLRQDLLQHQKVHEQHEQDIPDDGKRGKKMWAKIMGDDSKIQLKKKRRVRTKRRDATEEKRDASEERRDATQENRDETTERRDATAAARPASTANPMIEPKGTSDNVFKCNKCKTIFPNQKVLTNHVLIEHKNGGEFQCQYCGKDFPSMSNMKKHVRFHLGYRVRCSICNEIFSNVGALRKHTRLVHPDIYKARRQDKLARDGALRVTDKKRKEAHLAKHYRFLEKNKRPLRFTADKIQGESKNSETLPVKETASINNKEDSKEVKGEEEFLLETDITFEAHEIDDGGSRFKFSCTVCKKRFNSYINMCRHRRKVHSSENKQKLEEGLIFTRKSKNSTPPINEDPKELEQFYANISHNIAVNLNCFLDGKPEALEKYSDHITVENYTEGVFGFSEKSVDVTLISWEQYNFPPDFKPAITVPICDIKTEPVDALTIDSRRARTDLEVEPDLQEKEDQVSKSESVPYSESVENRIPESKPEINQVVESPENTMGKSSTGIKALANVGINAMHKIAKSLEHLTGPGDSERQDLVQSDVPDRDQLQKNSPSSKNFFQVKNGEYSNFDDLMLGDDFSPLTPDAEFRRNRAHSSASTRMLKRKLRYKRSHSAGDLIDADDIAGTPDELYSASQAELDELYDCLDTGLECSAPKQVTSLKVLSIHCGEDIDVEASDMEHKPMIDDYSGARSKAALTLMSNLSLSENQGQIENDGKTKQNPVPDYSDASIESPFYNYDSIAFGRNGEITKVCAICKKHFADFDCLIQHHSKIHPSSACNFLEIEDGNDIESLHFAHPSNFGVLAISDPGLASAGNIAAFTCTRCGTTFKSKARLHVHIVSCSPIDPVYGAIKDTSSKCPIKKRPNQKVDEQSKQGYFNNQDITSQKRVFTGCRKRTAVLLPDSPIKSPISDKTVQDILSGYNPNKHVRRRELTELVDTLTCEACGQKFKTIILLERHVKNCAEKEKFKNVRPLACPIMDESLAKIKNICFYCDKNFTYSKSLINHFQDFCPVKKAKADRGGLTKEDILRENKIMGRLQRQDEEKSSKDKEMEGHKKKSWQVGRKPKRKGHSWTYIKKRKQNMLTSQGGVQENEMDDGEFSDESSGNGSFQNGMSDTENDYTKDQEESSQKQHDANGNFVVLDRGASNQNVLCDYDEVDSAALFNAETDFYEDNNHDKALKSEGGMMEICERKKGFQEKNCLEIDREENDQGLFHCTAIDSVKGNGAGMNQLLSNWDRDANTSLEFTSRYRVNHVSEPNKKAVAKKPLLLQCVMARNASPKKELVSEKFERTKRKRERCGKVEAFLQNVFKRKKKKEALSQENQDKMNEKETKTTMPYNTKLSETNREIGNKLLGFPNTNSNSKSHVQIINNVNDDDITHMSNYFSQQDKETNPENNLTAELQGVELKKEFREIRSLDKNEKSEKNQPNENDGQSENVKSSDRKGSCPDGTIQPAKVSPGRGRPRKYPIKEKSAVKRPRGRPPKSVHSPDTNLQSNKVNTGADNKDRLPDSVDSQALPADDKQSDHLNENTVSVFVVENAVKNEQCTMGSNDEDQLDLQDSRRQDESNVMKPSDEKKTLENDSVITESAITGESLVKVEPSDDNVVQEVTSRNVETPSYDILPKRYPKDASEFKVEKPLKDLADPVKCVQISEKVSEHIPVDSDDKDMEDKDVSSRFIDENDSELAKPPTLECESIKNESNWIEGLHNTNDGNSACMPKDVPPVLKAEVDQVSSSDTPSVCVDDNSVCDSGEVLDNVADACLSNKLSSTTEKTLEEKVSSKPEESDKHSEIKVVKSELIEKTEGVSNKNTQNESTEKSTFDFRNQEDESLDESESVPNSQHNESQSESESIPKGVEDDENLLELYSSVILSPSERVKTNKRSCKKAPSPYSPVWVKQKKPKSKSGNVESESDVKEKETVINEKQETSTETDVIENGFGLVEGANSDLQHIPKALKRKMEIVRKFDSRRKMQKQ